jgi:hypothetical protein
MSVTIPIWSGSSTYVTGNSPFGYFDNDAAYTTVIDEVASWTAKRLGYPVTDVELQDVHFYSAFEEAITEYSALVNTYDLIDNFMNIQGSSTNQDNAGLIKRDTLNAVIKMSKAYSTEIGVGGSLTYYSGAVDILEGQQSYNLTEWALNEGITGSIEIRRIFWETPPAVSNVLQPYAGLGGGISAADPGMWGGFGGGGGSGGGFSHLMMPVYVDMLRLQAVELNQLTRRSQYSFELINNQLKIFPLPSYATKVWFQYIKSKDRFDTSEPDQANKVSGFHNANYSLLPYTSVNTIGRRWIFKYTLALAKETLGQIRSKFASIPIPGSETTLNGDSLITQAQTEQENLREEMKLHLEGVQRQNQLERKQAESANTMEVLQKFPMPFRIG